MRTPAFLCGITRKRVAAAKLRRGEGTPPYGLWKRGCRAACPRPPCPFAVRSSLADHCRGRRPRRPAEVGGGGKVRGRDESLPYGLSVSGSLPGGGGGVKTPPYDAKDKGAAMARLRAGHARPLRGDVNGLRTRGAREGGSPPPFPLTGGGVRPVKAPQASQARPAPHCVGRLFARAKPAGGASLVKGRCRAQARRRDSWPSAGVTDNPARPVGIPQSANAASPL